MSEATHDERIQRLENQVAELTRQLFQTSGHLDRTISAAVSTTEMVQSLAERVHELEQQAFVFAVKGEAAPCSDEAS